MNKIVDVLAGIGILIAIYLFIANGTNSVRIVNALGTNTISGIKTLQGR